MPTAPPTRSPRASSSVFSRARDAATLLIAFAAVLGCQPAPPAAEMPLETVEVEAADAIDPSNDPTASAPAGPQLAGLLPQDVPADLPIPLPASVDDFGRAADGARTVTIAADAAPDAARADLRRRAAAGGWLGGAAGDGALTLQRGGATVRVTIEGGDRGGSRLRYRY
ncbi:MAG: hypothetical protein AAF772_12590 [Acidobacteriota bacterium]